MQYLSIFPFTVYISSCHIKQHRKSIKYFIHKFHFLSNCFTEILKFGMNTWLKCLWKLCFKLMNISDKSLPCMYRYLLHCLEHGHHYGRYMYLNKLALLGINHTDKIEIIRIVYYTVTGGVVTEYQFKWPLPSINSKGYSHREGQNGFASFYFEVC